VNSREFNCLYTIIQVKSIFMACSFKLYWSIAYIEEEKKTFYWSVAKNCWWLCENYNLSVIRSNVVKTYLILLSLWITIDRWQRTVHGRRAILGTILGIKLKTFYCVFCFWRITETFVFIIKTIGFIRLNGWDLV
jgi:hypothetical protein